MSLKEPAADNHVWAPCVKCGLTLPMFWCGFTQCRLAYCKPCLTRHIDSHTVDLKVGEHIRDRLRNVGHA